MYTFGILAVFFIILSGAIFGKNIKQNQLMVAIIVIAGTMVGSVIVNGVLGLSIPYSDVEVRTKNLSAQVSNIYTPTDTLEFRSFIEFNYQLKEGKKNPDHNYCEVNTSDDIYSHESDMLTIKFIPDGDSIAPYVSIIVAKRIVDNKWITPFGLPTGGRHYVAYIPNDSIHNVLMNQLTEKFYKDEEQLAELN